MQKRYTSIYIHPEDKTIHYYTMCEGKKNDIIHDIMSYHTNNFDAEFYASFTKMLKYLSRKHPLASAANTTIVLPDSVVFSDILTLPSMRSLSIQTSVNSVISSAYKNRNDLSINVYTLQTKPVITSFLTGVRNKILTSVRTACTNSKLLAKNITFASNATVNAVSSLLPKLRNSTYVLLDIKDNYSKVVYVYQGAAIGFASLPFGYSSIRNDMVVPEDILFDHSVAALAVKNAHERARTGVIAVEKPVSDAITVSERSSGDSEEEEFEVIDRETLRKLVEESKRMQEKTPRKLPKYMLRPKPDTEEGFICENFRVFAKWALCYIAENETYTSLGAPEAIYVNMPSRFSAAVDKINEEANENGIKFEVLGLAKEPREIKRNLELYGGMFAGKMSSSNNF